MGFQNRGRYKKQHVDGRGHTKNACRILVKEHLEKMLPAVTRVIKNCSRKGPNSRVQGSQMNSASVATMLNPQFIQGASVNRAILQYCFFWFGKNGADVAIAILLPILKRFSFN